MKYKLTLRVIVDYIRYFVRKRPSLPTSALSFYRDVHLFDRSFWPYLNPVLLGTLELSLRQFTIESLKHNFTDCENYTDLIN